MKYFKDILGTINYNGYEVINIFKRLDFTILKSDNYLIDYEVRDGETPESIASDLYGKKDYFWIIMITNEFHNRFFDFPISIGIMDKIIEDWEYDGYSTDDINKLIETNNSNRMIKVLDPAYLDPFILRLKKKLKG